MKEDQGSAKGVRTIEGNDGYFKISYPDGEPNSAQLTRRFDDGMRKVRSLCGSPAIVDKPPV